MKPTASDPSFETLISGEKEEGGAGHIGGDT